MTLLLFDTEAMDQTAGMLRDGAGEYEVLSSQVRADADLGSMPAQTAAWVSDVIASVSQTLSQLTSDLSSDAELLAWRSEEARLADDPSLGALADAIFGLTSAVGLSSLFANTAEGYAAGVDPLGVPAGCAGCIGGYAAATYEPTGEEPTDETQDGGSYTSVNVGDDGSSVVVPIDGDLYATPDDGSSVSVMFDTPQYGPDAGTSVVVPLDDTGGPSITIPVWAPGTAPDYSAYPSGSGGSASLVDISGLVNELDYADAVRGFALAGGPDPGFSSYAYAYGLNSGG